MINIPDDTYIAIWIDKKGLSMSARNKALLFAANGVILAGIGSIAVWPLLLGFFIGGLLR